MIHYALLDNGLLSRRRLRMLDFHSLVKIDKKHERTILIIALPLRLPYKHYVIPSVRLLLVSENVHNS